MRALLPRQRAAHRHPRRPRGSGARGAGRAEIGRRRVAARVMQISHGCGGRALFVEGADRAIERGHGRDGLVGFQPRCLRLALRHERKRPLVDGRKPRAGACDGVGPAPDPSCVGPRFASVVLRRPARAYPLSRHVVLELFDFLPRLQSPPDGAQVECFDEDRRLVHAQDHLARDFLVPENLAVVLLDADGKQILGNLVGVPRLDLQARMGCLFLLVRLLALDV